MDFYLQHLFYFLLFVAHSCFNGFKESVGRILELYFVLLMKSHLQSYPCPLQINSFWNLGFLLGITIFLQLYVWMPVRNIETRRKNSESKSRGSLNKWLWLVVQRLNPTDDTAISGFMPRKGWAKERDSRR